MPIRNLQHPCWLGWNAEGRTGPTFCWLYTSIKNGAYIGNSCFVHNTSFAGLTTIVNVYALILIMTEIKCKNCNCNETLNIFLPLLKCTCMAVLNFRKD